MSKSDLDIRMLVTVEASGTSASWGRDYFHVNARPMKMRWEEGDGRLMPYGTFYTHEGDPFYEHLSVTSQGDVSSGHIYAFKVEYVGMTGVGLHDCERMVKVLRKVERKLTEYDRELGYVAQDDIAQYVARAGKAMGVSRFGFHPRNGATTFANGERYHWTDASYLGMNITDRINDLRERAGVEVER